MAGITIQNYTTINSDGTVTLSGTVEADEGTSVTLTLVLVEGLVVGTNSTAISATGELQLWSLNISPLTGAWSYGTAIAVGTLVSAENVQIADATQNVSVNL